MYVYLYVSLVYHNYLEEMMEYNKVIYDFTIFQYGIGLKSITALAKRYGTKFKVGNIAETICT